MNNLIKNFLIFFKSNEFILGVIFTFFFIQGLLLIIGLPREVFILPELFILLLFIKSVLYKIREKNSFKAFGYFPITCILIITIISYLINDSKFLSLIFFCRKIFIFYLFFIALQNLIISKKTIIRVNRLIILLFLIQIPASVIKFILIGQEEGLGIGTVSLQAGQLSTMLPLFAISFLSTFYFFEEKKRYIFIIFGFVFFAFVGMKRAFPLFLPVILIFTWYLYWHLNYKKYSIFKFNIKKLKHLIIIISIVFITIFIYVFFSKDEFYSGNAIGQNKKQIFINNRVQYIIWYNSVDTLSSEEAKSIRLANEIPRNAFMGRFKVMYYSIKKLKESGIVHLLFGFGPGCMIESPYLGQKNIAFKKFSIYGPITGFVFFILQIGFLGVFFLVSFFCILFKKVYKLYQKTTNFEFKKIMIGFLGVTFLAGIDFFLYGISILFLGILILIYYYIAFIILDKEI